MNKQSELVSKKESRAIANRTSKRMNQGLSTAPAQLADNRSEFDDQISLAELANHTPQANQIAQLQAMADGYTGYSVNPVQKKPNHTGLPDNLKSGIENLSGYSMDDVKVHFNSGKPAQLQAHAYAQGSEIHLGPGQEKHLPHEAWHVVQQKQGRVRPTLQMKGNIQINDDQGLEKEADEMGEMAYRNEPTNFTTPFSQSSSSAIQKVVQRKIFYVASSTEFQVDGKKPSFMGVVKKMALTPSQSRDHIVPYAAIENDLAVLLNEILAGNATAWSQIVDLSESLYPSKATSPLYAEMVKARTALDNAISAGNAADYEKCARALLSRLNSSPDNVRVGDSALNSSIGENLDVDFLPGKQIVSAGPGLQVNGNTGLITLPPGTEYLRLKPNSERIIYEYQTHTKQELSFVFDAASRIQLSSVDAPSAAPGASLASIVGKPVVVFGPSAMSVPFYYA